MKSKIYLSRKFYADRPLSPLDPDTELCALDSMKDSLLQREEYEIVQLVQNRINELVEEINNQQIIESDGTN
jgi:hypothetical protein